MIVNDYTSAKEIDSLKQTLHQLFEKKEKKHRFVALAFDTNKV